MTTDQLAEKAAADACLCSHIDNGACLDCIAESISRTFADQEAEVKKLREALQSWADLWAHFGPLEVGGGIPVHMTMGKCIELTKSALAEKGEAMTEQVKPLSEQEPILIVIGQVESWLSRHEDSHVAVNADLLRRILAAYRIVDEDNAALQERVRELEGDINILNLRLNAKRSADVQDEVCIGCHRKECNGECMRPLKFKGMKP